LTKVNQTVDRPGQAGGGAAVQYGTAIPVVWITPEMIDAGGGALLSSGWPDDCNAFYAANLVYQAMVLAAPAFEITPEILREVQNALEDAGESSVSYLAGVACEAMSKALRRIEDY
jgi:hypothetical protein